MKTINIAEILSPDLSFRELARGLRRFMDEIYVEEELTIDLWPRQPLPPAQRRLAGSFPPGIPREVQ